MIDVKASMQAAFDTATAALIAQGKQCFGPGPDGTTMCLYRGANGTKCAIGHLLSDEQIEKYAVREDTCPSHFASELLEELVPTGLLITGDPYETTQVEFLRNLQMAHDRAYRDTGFVESFTEKANAVAEKFGLNPISSTELIKPLEKT